jgi:CMP-N,N'-diacetyllegionaminic acid synthase
LNILALIPARSGSKSIPDKNILSLRGKPMLAFSVEHAIQCPEINRVIVSTDSEAYASIAESFGAEIPFLRPASLSGDLSTDEEVFFHALTELGKTGYYPDIIVHLRPTTPFRKPEDISAMIKLLVQNKEWDSVRSVVRAPESPYKMWTIENGELITVAKLPHIKEPFNSPRQILPQVFLQNASIDVTRYDTIMQLRSMTGNRIGAYLMDEFIDIDEPRDLNEKLQLDFSGCEGETFCFDIDGVIAHISPKNDYSIAEPNLPNIARVNRLYAQGNRIILFTARGSKTGIDWSEITRKQMLDWGVQYHELLLGKPAADYYVDDRAIELNQLIKWNI